MRIDIVSIFPDAVDHFLHAGLIGKARERSLLEIQVHDPREYTNDPHRSVDDAPYGGGAGMVMTIEPLVRLIEAMEPPRPVIALNPSGRKFDQAIAQEMAELPGFTLVCGRYEGIDQRFIDHYCDTELSLGDFVLNGGEAAAICVVEAVCRLVPTVMGNAESARMESFTNGCLEYPHYSRPAEFRGLAVPPVLLSGNHRAIEEWRHQQSMDRTRSRRPDLRSETTRHEEERQR